MPAVKQTPITIMATTSPIVTATSVAFDGRDSDHLWMYITFTLGSLTNIIVKPQMSPDGITFYDVYDAAQTLISYTFAASFTGALLVGSNNTNSRMQPLAFCCTAFQFVTTTTGTTTSSSLSLTAFPFSIGGIRE